MVKEVDDCLLLWKHVHAEPAKHNGFEFMCVEWASEYDDGMDHHPEFNVMFRGVAYFDGVRHLYFGAKETDNLGYHYYPDIPLLLQALTALDNLQLQELDYYRKDREDAARKKGS